MNTPDHQRTQLLRIRQMHRKLQLPYQEPAPDADLDALERTLKYLMTIEEESTSTLSRQLITDGIELPPPDSLDDDGIVVKLRDVINGLARRHTVLHNTNHLDDRALYRHLWEHTLNEPSHELDDSMGDCTEHIDLIGDGSAESERIYLQYYADDFDRRDWSEDLPVEPLPAKLDPPSNRDRGLPKQASDIGPEPDPSEFDEAWQADAHRHLTAARDYYSLGSFKLAHAELDVVGQIDTQGKLQIGVTIMRMEFYLDDQRWEEASTCGQLLCELAPDQPHHFVNHAHALYEAGECAKALRVLDGGPRSLLDNPLYHYHRARCEVHFGQHEQAIRSIKTALSLDPGLQSSVREDPELAPVRDLVFEDSPKE